MLTFEDLYNKLYVDGVNHTSKEIRYALARMSPKEWTNWIKYRNAKLIATDSD